jgi:hypothetical protein
MMGWLVFLAILLGYFWMVRREAIGFARREVEDFIRRYEILYPDAHDGAALIHGWNRDGALTCAPLDQAHTLDSAYTPTD